MVQCDVENVRMQLINSSNIYYIEGESELLGVIHLLLDEDVRRDSTYLARRIGNRAKRHAKERDQYWLDSEKATLPREEIEESKFWDPIKVLGFTHPETGEIEEIHLANRLYLLREEIKPYLFLVYHCGERPIKITHEAKERLLIPLVNAWNRSLHFEKEGDFETIMDVQSKTINDLILNDVRPLSVLFGFLEEEVMAVLQNCVDCKRYFESVLQVAESDSYYIDESMNHLFRRLFNPSAKEEIDALVYLCHALYFSFLLKYMKSNFDAAVEHQTYACYDNGSLAELKVGDVLISPHFFRTSKVDYNPLQGGYKFIITMEYRQKPFMHRNYLLLNTFGDYMWCPYVKFRVKELLTDKGYLEVFLEFEEDETLPLIFAQVVLNGNPAEAEGPNIKKQRYLRDLISKIEKSQSLSKKVLSNTKLQLAMLEIEMKNYDMTQDLLTSYVKTLQ